MIFAVLRQNKIISSAEFAFTREITLAVSQKSINNNDKWEWQDTNMTPSPFLKRGNHRQLQVPQIVEGSFKSIGAPNFPLLFSH